MGGWGEGGVLGGVGLVYNGGWEKGVGRLVGLGGEVVSEV